MPIYTYRCESCGVQFERNQKFSDTPLTRCPECGKKSLRKVYLPVGIVFKGSGFYSTDHRSPSGGGRAGGAHSDEKQSDEKRSDEKRSEEKRSDEKRSDEKRSDEKQSSENKPAVTDKNSTTATPAENKS